MINIILDKGLNTLKKLFHIIFISYSVSGGLRILTDPKGTVLT